MVRSEAVRQDGAQLPVWMPSSLAEMVFPLIGAVPPLRTCGVSWRELYESGCFYQRELEDEGALATEARKRGFTLSQVGAEEWERWDGLGVLHPVAFSKTAYAHGRGMPALPPEYLVFRDEQDGFCAIPALVAV